MVSHLFVLVAKARTVPGETLGVGVDFVFAAYVSL